MWLVEAGHDALHTLDLPQGNISNDELECIVRAHVDEIAEAFAAAAYVELGREFLTVHE